MAGHETHHILDLPAFDRPVKLLIVVAPYYKDIADDLVAGARAVAARAGATAEVVEVPGALEVPAAIGLAFRLSNYDGFVALGCVIRGETTHYDYVCGESARGLMDLAVQKKLAIGYGIVTVETVEQARTRAYTDRGDKGGDAAHACLAMVALGRRWKKT